MITTAPAIATTVFTTLDTPFGTAVIASAEQKIHSVRIMTVDGRYGPDPSWQRADSELCEARAQLTAYFAGELREFSLPLSLAGTPFQQQAWTLLRAVPYGSTTTYGKIASDMDKPNASRAVGLAMNRNPITIIVPCHRVVGKSGNLTGYLNGLDMKRSLLAMESGDKTPTAQSNGRQIRAIERQS